MNSHLLIHPLGQLPRVYSSLSRRWPGSTAAGPAPNWHAVRRAPQPTAAATPRDLPAPLLRPSAPPSPAPYPCHRLIGRPPPARRCFFSTRQFPVAPLFLPYASPPPGGRLPQLHGRRRRGYTALAGAPNHPVAHLVLHTETCGRLSGIA
jgi:hypothetical protein